MATTRRTFLAAGAVAPFVWADDKAGAKNPILGEGEHKYECIHDWGELPSNIKYGNTHSVVEDSQGHIYIHHTVHSTSQSPDAVVVFDNKGKFVRSFGAMFKGGAHGMHISKEGKNEYLYFCDEKHGIVTKRTLKGEEVWTMGYPQASPIYQKGPGSNGPGGAAGLNYRPTNMAIASNGDFWVGDGYGSYYMFHYTQKGSYPELVRTFGGRPPQAEGQGRGGPGGPGRGGPGRGPGGPGAAPGGGPGAGGPPPSGPVNAPIETMNNPHGVWLDTRDAAKPVLMVADRGNRRIVRYTLDDKPIDIVEGTKAPCHFHQLKDMLVVPDLQSRVTLLDKDNRVIVHMGDGDYQGKQNQLRVSENRADFEPGKFITPHGAWFDHTGNIFVTEWVEIGRVTKLRKVA
ncbi:MAG TPA: hypothetical protein VG096_14900 [Bryobacteraceae bacterium]|jgi:hypothetical protein|nr:hypothetical protein [Bryobacteraceae bacterium]